MATKKQQMDYAEIADILSAMSKKDYRDMWRITRAYRRANRMLDKTLARQEREFMLPNKASNTESASGLKYELA